MDLEGPAWDAVDWTLGTASTALILADWLQTLHFTSLPPAYGVKESNPILGPHPSKLQVDLVAGAALAANLAVAIWVPRPFKYFWLVPVVGVVSWDVYHNATTRNGNGTYNGFLLGTPW
ncbi:MAG TPA: hypothetical protein VMT17_11200 [Anaeromyxobacteraceae bacterium]|nr:hypothetical protein [Anaeromyxobacteraceae bacterium]